MFKVTPTPKVPQVPPDEQPFEMNIYKTLYYFLFTIVGGLIYVCILFLYLQQLTKGQDEFAQFFNITARAPWSTPTPTTTTQAAQPPSEPQQQQRQEGGVSNITQNNNNSSNIQGNAVPSSTRSSSKHHKQSTKGEEHHTRSNHTSNGGGGGVGASGGGTRKRHHTTNVININPVEAGPVGPAGPQLDPGMKDPCAPGSPSSPMFPYFLMRGSGSSKPQPPPRCIMDEPPPPMWQRGPPPPPLPPIRQDFSSLVDPGGTPRSGGSEPIPRNLLSPSRLVGVGVAPPMGVPPPPPPHHFPAFYPDSGDDRRESFQGPVGGYSSYPPSQSGYSSRAGGGPESLYQKIPMSPATFDYGLR